MGQTGKGLAAQGFRPDETRLRGTFICQSALRPILGRRSQRPNRLLYAGSTRLRRFCFSARMALPMDKPEVDLALVLAVDTSSSMDPDKVHPPIFLEGSCTAGATQSIGTISSLRIWLLSRHLRRCVVNYCAVGACHAEPQSRAPASRSLDGRC